MKILILDVETGGLDPTKNPLLSIGAKVFGKDLTFYGECSPRNGTICTDIALKINGLNPGKDGLMTEKELLEYFKTWCEINGPFDYMAGVNIGFDSMFLRVANIQYGFGDYYYRKIEIQTIALMAHLQGLISLPIKKGAPSLSLDSILSCFGLRRDGSTHTAISDVKLTDLALSKLLERSNIKL